MGKQCSDIFAEVFDSHSSGIVRTCHCGRTFFDQTDECGWEEGELEDLLEKSARYPNQYIPIDNTVWCMKIDNIEIVYGCECETAKKYENFIRNNAKKLSEYLRSYAKALREKADMVDVIEFKS